MAYIKTFFSLAIVFLLSGCLDSRLNLQATSNPTREQTIKDIKKTYILQQQFFDFKTVENKLYFSTFHNGKESRQEKLLLTKGNTKWQVERRTDNGSGGSGRIFNIDFLKEKKNKTISITFIPTKEIQYQEGLILPFSVPEWNIKSYLSSAEVRFSFELNSKYSPDSVKANFDRYINDKSETEYYSSSSTYYLPLNGAYSSNKIKFYPYKNGTKLVFNSSLSKMKVVNNTVDVRKSIKSLKDVMNKILNL
jgi:hypothetical protein